MKARMALMILTLQPLILRITNMSYHAWLPRILYLVCLLRVGEL